MLESKASIEAGMEYFHFIDLYIQAALNDLRKSQLALATQTVR